MVHWAKYNLAVPALRLAMNSYVVRTISTPAGSPMLSKIDKPCMENLFIYVFG